LVQIFSTPCSQTPYVPPLMSETQVSHPYRTTGKIIVSYILIFMFRVHKTTILLWFCRSVNTQIIEYICVIKYLLNSVT
jgi:hypothetical protein